MHASLDGGVSGFPCTAHAMRYLSSCLRNTSHTLFVLVTFTPSDFNVVTHNAYSQRHNNDLHVSGLIPTY